MRVSTELFKTASEYPDKHVVIMKDRKLTFRELVETSNRLCGYLRSVGVEAGDRVVMWLPNCLEFVTAYFAILQAGAACVPVDIRLGREAMMTVFDETKAKALVTVNSLLKSLDKLKADRGAVLTVDGSSGDSRHLAEVVSETPPDENVEPREEDDDALILYTSGTAGRSKGVRLSFGHMSLFPETMRDYLHLAPEDSYLCVLPMSHISGPILCNSLALLGNAVVVAETMNPKSVVESSIRHKPTIMHAVPTLFNLMLRMPRFDPASLGSMRIVAMMGEPVPLWLMQKYNEMLPEAKVLQGYGLTETSPLVTLVPVEDADEKMGSIGKAVPGCDVEIMDDKGGFQPPRVVGEIVVRGPQVMKGYYLNPAKTRKVVRDGWFHTGDLGWKDEDGFFYHAGRADEVINTGGLMVYPPEVEQVLSQHPDVVEALIDGPSDPKRGQYVRATVVLKPGAAARPEDLLSFMKPHLESYKLPRKIDITDSLEKSSTGKIQRKRESPGSGSA